MSSYYSKFGYVFGGSDIDERLNIIEASVNDKVNGDVSSTNNALVRWDGTTGKNIQNSTATLTDIGGLFADTIDTTKISTDTISEYGENGFILATTNLDTGSNYVRSSYTPLASNDLVNKSYSDSNTVNKVIGAPASTDKRICVFDGTTGKLIKQENISITDTRIQAFDGITGLPTVLEINNDVSLLGSDLASVGAIGCDSVNTDIISANTGSVITFNNKPQSGTAPTVSDDLVNKSYSDSNTVNKVIGSAGSTDRRVCVFDGTTGKLIRQENLAISGALIEGFDDVGNPSRIEMGNDLYMFENDIGAVSDLGVDSITANTGSVITFNNKPQSNAPPTVSDDLVNKLYVDDRVGNLYAMIADGSTVQVSGGTADPETSLLPSGVGTSVGSLTVPANGFSVGDSFHFVLAGQCIYDTSNDITLKLKNGGILAELTMNLENTDNPNTYWELEADFTIRSIGVAGSIVTNFDFTFNKRLDKDFKGQRSVSVSTINTTISNTLDITAEFIGTSDSSMFAQLAYLKRMY